MRHQQKEVFAGFYAGWSFVLSLVACAGILQAYYSLDSRWLAFSFAGVFSLAILLHRMNQHDQLLTAVNPAPLPAPQVNPTTPPKTLFRPMVAQGETKTLVGKFAFTDDQLSKIALVVTQANGTFSRDVVESARAVPEIKKVWAELKADFERCGFIQGTKLTDAGWQLLTDSPTPPQGGAQ